MGIASSRSKLSESIDQMKGYLLIIFLLKLDLNWWRNEAMKIIKAVTAVTQL